MKKILLIFVLLTITNCQKEQVIKTHGIAYLEKRQKSLIVKEMNKNDVRKIIGNPSTEGMFEETVWIYIERSQTRGKLLKLGQNVTLKSNVLVLKFDKYGILKEKEFYNKDRMNKIKFTKDKTKGVKSSRDFVYSFLSSIRQKMFKKK